ncbi:hypothetical protein SLS57_009811 [Botryosphaeria dothidea]
MASYLITGSSRGIGLALVTLLASKPVSEVSKVFAAARKQNSSLEKLVQESGGRVEFIQLDVTDEQGSQQASKTVEKALNGKGLDILINNAGIMNYTPNGIENMTDLDETFKVNVIGVHNVTTAFLPLLKKGSLKKVINISTTLGSIGMAPVFNFQPTPAYKVSKAALNMLTVQYAQAFAEDGLVFVAWVKTDLGTEHADLTIEQSINGISEILSRVTDADTGKFFTVNVPEFEKDGQKLYDGSCRPW